MDLPSTSRVNPLSSWRTEPTDAPVSTVMPSSANAFSSSSEASGSSIAIRRSAISTTVTSTP